MTVAVFYKLLAIFITVALGWVVGRMRWLDTGNEGGDPARLLGNVAFYIFVPALLFRTTARIDFSAMPWRTVAAFFVPVVLFGEKGLEIHVALVSLHAIILLSVLTALAETDIARHRGGASRLLPMLRLTLHNTIVHPVVLPVLAGLIWNAAGIALPPVMDEVLVALGSAVVPVCLVLIGLTLAYYDVRGQLRGAVVISVLKLVCLPALVLGVAHWGFGLSGLPLSVVVVMAALPAGSNALIFSQRYATLQAEATAAIVLSTVGFVATASWWLGVLAWLAR